MPPRPKFSAEQLQKAALRVVDRRGLHALSMRSLAAALRTGPMTLYNYVQNREALDALIVDAVMAEASYPAATGEWRADVRANAVATWRAIRSHPHALPLILARRGLHPTTLEPAEALLGALAASGRSGGELLAAFRAVHGFVMGFAQIRLAGKVSQRERAAGEADETVAHVRALSPLRFPKLVEAANAAARLSLDEEFEAALDVVLAGLERSR